jgi:alpha-glucosidase
VTEGSPWWRDAVVYQVYPRSFQDSDGDGVGDIRGVTSRLDHLRRLGVDALWLSPFYPSPGADCGYDISDFTGVDPGLGTLADVDELIASAHARDLRVLFDFVPSHTSIEHPWFREHPDWYAWADDGPPNNWVGAFGGPAWTRDERSGRWYLHSFYPEQPDLNWGNPEVREAMGDVVRFWRDRGADGFRVDAVQGLAKNPDLRDDPPAAQPFPLPLHPDAAGLDHVHSQQGPGMWQALAAIREAAGERMLVGEVYVPNDELAPYLEYFDLAFSFEFLFAQRDAVALVRIIESGAALGRAAWVLSNHDFPRLVSRFGSTYARLAAVLLLTLPGTAFIYQGDEIGMTDGPGASPPIDRLGRDGFRHPMQWEAGETGGFSTGEPWVPPIDPDARNVTGQEGAVGSMLELYRALIALRRELGAGIADLLATGDVLSYRRGEHLIALNLGEDPAAVEQRGDLVLSTSAGHRDGELAPGEATIVRRMV